MIQPLLKAWINTFNPPNVSLRWIVLSGPHLQIEEMKVRTLTKSSTKMGSSGVTSPKSDLDSRGHTCHQIQRGLKYWVPSCWSGYLDCKLQSQTKKCVCVCFKKVSFSSTGLDTGGPGAQLCPRNPDSVRPVMLQFSAGWALSPGLSAVVMRWLRQISPSPPHRGRVRRLPVPW